MSLRVYSIVEYVELCKRIVRDSRNGKELYGRFDKENPDDEFGKGFTGQACFSLLTGLPAPYPRKHGSDDGYDYWIYLMGELITFDVKIYPKPKTFWLKAAKANSAADIIVQGKWIQPDFAQFLTWEFSDVLRARPVRKSLKGIFNHEMNPDRTRDIRDLVKLIGMRDDGYYESYNPDRYCCIGYKYPGEDKICIQP